MQQLLWSTGNNSILEWMVIGLVMIVIIKDQVNKKCYLELFSKQCPFLMPDIYVLFTVYNNLC